MEMKDCCFETTQFFEPGAVVWIIRQRKVIATSVTSVRFEAVKTNEPGENRFTLMATDYRLLEINPERDDWYFPLYEVYATKRVAVEQARWISSKAIPNKVWEAAIGSREAYEAYTGGEREISKECELQPCCADISALRDLLHRAWRHKGLIHRDVVILSRLAGHGWDKVRIPALLRIFSNFNIHVEGETS